MKFTFSSCAFPEKTTGNILNGYELSDVEDYLSDDDIEKIYTQLIDKEIL